MQTKFVTGAADFCGLLRLDETRPFRGAAWQGATILLVILAIFVCQSILILSVGNHLAVYNLGIDTDKYHSIAREFVSHLRGQVPITQPPGFVLALASLYWLLGTSVVAAKVVIAILLAVATLVVALRLKVIFSLSVAILFCLLLGLSPMVFAYVGTLQYEPLVLCMALLCLSLFLEEIYGSSAGIANLIALAIGCSVLTLTREVLFFLFPLLLLVIPHSKRSLGTKALVLFMYATPIIAWILWQYSNHGKLVFISDKGAFNFAIGFNPNANGTFNSTLLPLVPPHGWQYIHSFPQDALHLVVRKLLYLVGYLEDGWNAPARSALLVSAASGGVLPLDVARLVTRIFLPLFALVGGFLLARDRKHGQLLFVGIASTGAVAFVHCVFISSHRFALPLYGFWAIAAAYALTWLLQKVLRARWLAKVMLSGSVLLGGYFVFVNRQVGSLRVNAQAMDGEKAENQCDATQKKCFRFAAKAHGRRRVAIIPDGFLPKGSVRISFPLRFENAASEHLLSVLLVNQFGRRICRQGVLSNGTQATREMKAELTCDLPQAMSVKLIMTTPANADLWIGDVLLSF
jgi:4-amino-4-deoxy-L-arabinose transferase-like glycosyltransferase